MSTLRLGLFRRLMPIMALLLLSGCSAGAPMAAPAAPAQSRADSSAAPQEFYAQAGGMAADSTTSAALQRKMIATASLSMVVDDVEATVDEVEAIVADAGGYIAGENLYDVGTGNATVMQGNLELRVPADLLEQTLDKLQALAVEVGTRTLEREDVTDRYSDVDAQLRNLQATETELREMLAEVRERPGSTPDDILAVHNRITEVRGQIEILQGQKNLLDNLIGLSTINLALAPDRSGLPVVEQGWQPGNTVRAAARMLVNTLQWLGDAAIWLVVVALPILLMLIFPIVILIAFVHWIIKRRRGAKGITIAAK